MNKLFKLLGIIFVLSLLALPLTGCDMGSGMTLNMKVDTPRDGTTVNASTVTVSGRVAGSESAGAKVSINGADVPVKDSKFSTEVTLIEGKNVINVDATAGQAKLNEKVNVTYAPAKKQTGTLDHVNRRVIVPRPGNFGRGEEDIYPAEAFHIYEGGKKEELPLGVKIIGVAICIGAVVLLATYDRLLKMLRLKKSKTK